VLQPTAAVGRICRVPRDASVTRWSKRIAPGPRNRSGERSGRMSVLDELYRSKIDFAVECDGEIGFFARICQDGKDLVGSADPLKSQAEVERWLTEHVCLHLPNSDFAKVRRPPDPSGQ
jgi:hypothetical protein